MKSIYFQLLFVGSLLSIGIALMTCNLEKIEPSGPSAAFTVARGDSLWEDCPVLFVNNSIGAVTYLWTFGDGQSSTEKSPAHVYSNAGSYSVSLVIFNDLTAIDTAFQEIKIYYVDRFNNTFYNLGSIQEAKLCLEGGFVVIGDRKINTDNWAFAMKLSKNGNIEWNRTLTSLGKEAFADAVAATPEGDIVIVGHTNNTNFTGDVFVIKLAKVDGAEIWRNVFDEAGNEEARGVVIGIDQKYYILWEDRTENKAFITNLNPLDGVKIGEFPLPSNFSNGRDIIQTNKGNLAVLGGVFGPLLLATTTGSILLNKTLPAGNGGSVYFEQIIETVDGGFAIVGAEDDGCCENNKIMLMGTDANGNVLFKKRYGNASYIFGYDVLQTPEGGFLVIGQDYKNAPANYDDYTLLVKTDRNGNTLTGWPKWYKNSGALEENGRSVLATDDCSYLIISKQFGNGCCDALIRKVDLNGN